VGNNPLRYTDSSGLIIDTITDLVSLGLSYQAYKDDPNLANGLGLAFDALATAVPGLPAGAGIIKNIGAKACKISTTPKQLGKKLGKHVEDFGGNPSNAADRQKVIDRIYNITDNPDKVVQGSFRGQGANGGSGTVNFVIQGSDVVVTTPGGEFVTILKDGINNPSVIKALQGL
jgi:hypothetical protein